MVGRALPGLLVAALALGALLVSPGAAEEIGAAHVEDLEVDVDGANLLLSFRLAGAFDQNLLRRIESGLPTELAFQLELQRDRKRWLDTQVRDSSLRVVAMYNAVNREYLINTRLDGKLISSRVIRESDQLEEEMTVFEDLPVFNLTGDLRRERLLVRARAELGTRTVLFFIPTTRTTPWAESATFVAADEDR